MGLILLGRAVYRDRGRVLEEARAIQSAFEALWDRGLVVVAPVSCYPPPRIGRTNRNFRLAECCMPGNIADATALALPFGRFGHLPRGVQLMGPPGSEAILLEVALDNEEALKVYDRARFEKVAVRPHYYPRPGGRKVDAQILSRPLGRGEP